MSIPYRMFIMMEPLYHQICSSDFVSSIWINFLSERHAQFATLHLEYQINLSTIFIVLRTLCESAQQTVNEALQTFLQAVFVSSEVVSEQIFESQIHSLIESWQLSTTNRYQGVIQLVRATNQGNLLLNDRYNFRINVSPTSGELISIPFEYSGCSCALSPSCSVPIRLVVCLSINYDCIEQYRFSDLFTGCFPVEALFQSKLGCFYDRTCVDAIRMYAPVPTEPDFDVLTLNRTGRRPNETTETVESIFNRLMVDSWLQNVSFESYFMACNPASCAYEYTSRQNVFIAIIEVIGILSGLSTGLKILVIIVIRSVEKMIEGYFRNILTRLMRNHFVCRDQQQMTRRIYRIILVIAVGLLCLVSFFSTQLATGQIAKPSLSTYQQLMIDFPDELQCTCSKISFKYETFLTIQPRFHQICSSEFVSERWFAYVYGEDSQWTDFNRTDFQATAIGQFQLLISLCLLSQETVKNSLSELLATYYINAQIASASLLDKRIQGIVHEFRLRIPKSFLNTLNIIRETSRANMLMSMYGSNWKFIRRDVSISPYWGKSIQPFFLITDHMYLY